jgi:hypothetical protein
MIWQRSAWLVAGMFRTRALIRRFVPLGLLLPIVAVIAGCSKSTDPPLGTSYGQGDEEQFQTSVNGLSVLADLFTKAGDSVFIEDNLSPQIKATADVIVWAPDDFGVPGVATIQWIDAWLRAKPGRTLIYIGRDFDAEPVYWRKILVQTPAPDAAAVKRQLDRAEQRFQLERKQIPQDARCEWFSIDNSQPHNDVRTLSGDWSTGIDASKGEIELNSRLISPDEAETLLASDDDELVSRFQVPGGASGGGQVILIANGSFLLNLPLVNHEHRKLAARLVESVGSAKQVVFFASYEGGTIRTKSSNKDDSNLPHSMIDIFGIWPLSVILTQWGLVLLLLCFSRWPIFGPPRDPPAPTASDFSRHVTALGEALELTRDEAFAKARWQHYQEQVRSQGGGLYSSGRGLASGSRKVRPENF